MYANPLQCLTFTLFILPPILLATYWFATFPYPPEPIPIHPGLASLSPSSSSRSLYPENFYEGGAYVTFPHGRVRYWILGPQNGKKVILIHGLSVPSLIYHRLVPYLTSANHRVLLYDLYGRGYSDAPQTTYDAPLYAIQLALLMQHVRWDSARLVGLSMGGSIVAYFTSTFPWLVENKVALLASTGLVESMDISRTVKLMSSPLVQSFTGSFVRKYMQRLTNSTTGTTSEPTNDIVRLQSAHLPGFNFAVASSLRDGPVRGMANAFYDLGRSGRGVLIIHGTADNTVPYRYAAQIQARILAGAESASNTSSSSTSTTTQKSQHALYPHLFSTPKRLPSSPSPKGECKLITLEGAGHGLVLDQAEEIGRALVEWFADD